MHYNAFKQWGPDQRLGRGDFHPRNLKKVDGEIEGVNDDPDNVPAPSTSFFKMNARDDGIYDAKPTAHSSHRQKAMGRLQKLIDWIPKAPCWTSDSRKDEDRLIKEATERTEWSWAPWLWYELFSCKGLVKYLESVKEKCTSLLSNGIEHKGPGKPIWVVGMGPSRYSNEELPLVFLPEICRAFKVIFYNSLFMTLAAYYVVLGTPLGMLLCLVGLQYRNTNRGAFESECVDGFGQSVAALPFDSEQSTRPRRLRTKQGGRPDGRSTRRPSRCAATGAAIYPRRGWWTAITVPPSCTTRPARLTS